MELTVDQALWKGVEAHKAGQVQEADRLYTAILKALPKHPDANHNMGVLAVGVGNVEEALPFFKAALGANPNTAQFWLSYIDTLIKLERLGEAKAVFDQAKGHGAKGEAFDKVEQRLKASSTVPSEAITKQLDQDPPSILDTLKLDQAIKLANQKSKDGFKATSVRPISKSKTAHEPTQDQQQALISLYNQGQFQQALDKVKPLLQKFPNSVTLYNIQGVANKGLGQFDAAIVSYEKALSIRPNYADAHFNTANIFREIGELEKAVAAYKKALTITPDNAAIHTNMGATFKQLGDLKGALEAYKNAVNIKPDNLQAYVNMGAIFREWGEPEQAIHTYKKALVLEPNTAMLHNNIGNALQDQGKLEEAIKSFKTALHIQPDYDRAWYNIFFPLKAIKMKVSSEEELLSFHPEATGSKISSSILNYKLSLGGENEKKFRDVTLNLLTNAKNIIIKNPDGNTNSASLELTLPDKVVVLTHFGRSGTGLMHSLIDGHPEVSTLPSLYFSEYFDHSTWENIIAGGWSEMADRFAAIYDVLFDASSNIPVKAKSKKLLYKIGQKEGMANVGNQRDEILSVNKILFRSELNRLIDYHDELDAFVFFKLVHVAFDKSINDLNQKNFIFYHIHNPDTYAQLNFVRLAPDAKQVMMVREPIQSCESWIKANGAFDNNDHSDVSNQIISMLFEINNIIYHEKRSIGVRLEDLKERPRKTIPVLCKWMGITETESLYVMTAQGKKWWGDPSSPDFLKDGMDPFGKTSIKRKIGSVFSDNDQFILRTLFYPFSVRFGYAEENAEKFKIDLQTIRPMLDEMFDFEKIIAERTDTDTAKFMKSGSYLYLRSGLIERWKTLNKLGTYSNMIKPLKLDIEV